MFISTNILLLFTAHAVFKAQGPKIATLLTHLCIELCVLMLLYTYHFVRSILFYQDS